MEVLRVSSTSNPNAVAGALANILRNHPATSIVVIGAAALNQAVKALAITRLHLRAEGLEPVCLFAFDDLEVDGAPRTAISMLVERRALTVPSASAHGAGEVPDGDVQPSDAVGDGLDGLPTGTP